MARDAFDISDYPEKSGQLNSLDDAPVFGFDSKPIDGLEDVSGAYVLYSGIDPSGYETTTNKLFNLQNNAGLFTGHIFDYRQERDFVHTTGNPGKGIQGFEGKGINRYYPSPTGDTGDFPYGNRWLQSEGLDENLPEFDGKLVGTSGIIITYPPSNSGYLTSDPGTSFHPEFTAYDGSKGSGIFNFAKLINSLSNASGTMNATGVAGISSFTIFNDYLHHRVYNHPILPAPIPDEQEGDLAFKAFPVKMPFVSDLTATLQIWDRYNLGKKLYTGVVIPDDEIFHELTDPSYD